MYRYLFSQAKKTTNDISGLATEIKLWDSGPLDGDGQFIQAHP